MISIIALLIIPLLTNATQQFLQGNFFGGIQEVYNTGFTAAYKGWVIPVIGFGMLGIIYNKTGSAPNALIVGVLMAAVIFTGAQADIIAVEVQQVAYAMLAITMAWITYRIYK